MQSVKNEPSTMDVDNSEEEEEETMYVLAAKEDLDDNDDNDIYFSKILGIDTEKPVMQINNKFYQGKWEKTMGTNLFFEEDPDVVISDPIFTQLPDKVVKYVCSSRKVLKLNRIVLRKKGDQEDEELEDHAASVEEAFAKLRAYSDTTTTEQEVNVDNEKAVVEGARLPIKKTRKMLRRVSQEYDDVQLIKSE